MKRSTLHRNARLKSKTPLKRSGRIRTVNRDKKTKAYARNFGDEADRVRAMPCIIRGAEGRVKVVPGHHPSRGAGGGRFNIFPIGTDLHDLQHSMGVETFQARYGVDLRAEADRVALEHPRPLGIRGLVDRWSPRCPYCRNHPGQDIRDGMCTDCPDCGGRCRVTEGTQAYTDGVVAGLIDPLDDYEFGCLFRWVRRRMGRHWTDCAEHRLALDLGIDSGQARALVEAAS